MKPQIWTDERTGRSFIVTRTKDDEGYTWVVERNTDTRERLGHVRREGKKIWVIASTVPDGKAEREFVESIENGFKVLTSGA